MNPTATNPSADTRHGLIPPLQLGPSAPSLKGVEEHSPALRLGIKTLAQKRLQRMLVSTPDSVVSHRRALSGADANHIADDDVALGMFGLGSMFVWEDAEVVWELEKSKAYAKKSRKARVNSESAVGSKLLAADQAYRDGDIEEAQEGYRFVEGHNKRQEFTVMITEGNLRLFQLGDVASAQHYYQRAVKLLQRRHLYFASYALLHQALCCFYQGMPDRASKLAKEAVELIPEFAEARYQYAQYEMFCERPDNAYKELMVVLCQDRHYILKIISDAGFNEIHDRVIEKITERREQMVADQGPTLLVGEKINGLLSNPCMAEADSGYLHAEMLENLQFAKDAAEQPGFLDVFAASDRIQRLFVTFDESTGNALTKLNTQESRLTTRLDKKRSRMKRRSRSKQRLIAGISLILGVSGCSSMIYQSQDPDTVIVALALALGISSIGGLLSMAIPRLMAGDEEYKSMRSELDAVRCQIKILKQVQKQLSGFVKDDSTTVKTIECVSS